MPDISLEVLFSRNISYLRFLSNFYGGFNLKHENFPALIFAEEESCNAWVERLYPQKYFRW